MRQVVLLVALLAALPLHGAMAEPLDLGKPVVMRAAAVAETADGFVGSTAAITITAAANGSGHIFLDTFPLAEIDMQGSARLAARVASQLTGKSLAEHDFFFVLRSGAQIIGGPSAGATMTVGAVAALQGWEVRDDVLMTGTVQPDGSVGPVGGIPEKAQAAAEAGVTRFLFPAGEEVVSFASDPRRTFNLTRHCADQLKIECIPVRDVREAVGLMTDHEFVLPPLTGNVTGEAYRALLGDVGRDLQGNARGLLEEARAAVDALPAGTSRSALAQRLAAAEGTLGRARAAADEGTHYTAASLSFQASVDARTVRDAARVLASRDPTAETTRVVGAARGHVDEARGAVESYPGLTTTRFEALGAAQVRLAEAEAHLAQAEAQMRAGNGYEAVASAAWAHERAGTATFWLDIARAVPEGEPLTQQGVAEAARDAITTSGEEVAYVRAVFQTRRIMVDVSDAEARLAEAERAYERGFYSAAMFTAIEASVEAGVLLEATGHPDGIPAGKFDQKREEAARAIQAARERGVEPLLAQSQYEFGLSLDASDPQLARKKLVFLGLSRMTANLAGLPGVFDEPRALQSRFVGTPPPFGVAPTYVAAAFAVGLALGAGCGLAALMPKDEDDAPEVPPPPEPVPIEPAPPERAPSQGP